MCFSGGSDDASGIVGRLLSARRPERGPRPRGESPLRERKKKGGNIARSYEAVERGPSKEAAATASSAKDI